MKSVQFIPDKIHTLSSLKQQVQRWRMKNKTIAFTNGVFDILHEGHIASLCEAATKADVLVVAVNSDKSVKKLKGPDRPINNENGRALLLASMLMIDGVIIFEEDTPLDLIITVMPDVLVKGGDYEVNQIAGSKEVIANGGEVFLATMIKGISTTSIIEKIKSVNK